MFNRFQVLVVVVLLAASVAGIGRLISGVQPKEGLHLVYAAIAVVALDAAFAYTPNPARLLSARR